QNNVMFELRIKTSPRQPMFEIMWFFLCFQLIIHHSSFITRRRRRRRAPLRENLQIYRQAMGQL
ncbi:MAG: hypothetical protein WCS73_12775, partial [Lentisphaeria bacterium]